MPPDASLRLIATPGRLDAVLAELARVSRSQVAGWIAGGHVQVGGVVVHKAGLKLRGGEAMTVQVPPPPDATVAPEDVPLDVLYEDEHLIAVNKPPGMVTHPAPGVTSGTLVNALLGRMTLPEQPGAEGPEGYRPGIVHRLDKDTSGVIVVAKSVEAHARLAAAFKDRETRKAYLAIAAGMWRAEGPVNVDAPIGRHPTARQRMTVGGPIRVKPRPVLPLLTCTATDTAARWPSSAPSPVPAAPTRFGSTSRTSAAQFWAIRCMGGRVRRCPATPCTPTSWPSPIPRRASGCTCTRPRRTICSALGWRWGAVCRGSWRGNRARRQFLPTQSSGYRKGESTPVSFGRIKPGSVIQQGPGWGVSVS